MEQYDSMYSYAIEYANYGLAVFPLKERDKLPLTAHGCKDATTDAAVIKAWWQRWPNANIGLATGQVSGGLYVIDMDRHEGGVDGVKAMADWQRSHGAISSSWTSNTGTGGMHYFFLDDEEHGNRAGILSSVDFRGDGGYVVAPPSIHPNGNRYTWNEQLSPDVMKLYKADDTIKHFINIGKDSAQTKYCAPAIIPQGERNAMLFKFACMMQAKGASDDAVFAATMAENTSKCNPSLSENEIRKLVDSVIKRYSKGKPIYVSSVGEATQGQRNPIFKTNEKGKILKTWENIVEAIEYDEKLYGSIKYNELANSVWVYGELPWEKTHTYRSWRNADDVNLKAYLEMRYGFNSTEKIMDALTAVADRNRFNPIVTQLEQIHNEYGECKGAIRKLLPEYMGAEDSEYVYEVMKVYMLGAISRAFYPGCKFDYSIILYGSQGFGKSEFFRHLAINSEWFNDNFGSFEGSKAFENLAGMWIVEMAELKALKSAKDSESFKAFLTSRVDTYRAPYMRRTEQRPRMCVFAGTTNDKNVFVDKTGNRRFLPIETRKGMQSKNLFGDQKEVMEDFKKAWSEAMDIFIKADRQPNLILPPEVQDYAEQMQEEFSEDDYRVGMIQNWLDQTDCAKVCVPMLIEYALQQDISKVPKHHKREIMEIMDNEIKGWSRVKNNDRGRTRCGKYGNQISFIKKNI